MTLPKTICDICILNSLPLRHRVNGSAYCNLETGVGVLEGAYRKMTPDDDEDHNYLCTYVTAREGHSKIFK